MNTKLVENLEKFYKGDKIEPFGSPKSKVTHLEHWNKLNRVFNDGNGCLEFATVHLSTLLINELLCSNKEISEIKKTLEIPFIFVQLWYPDYYSKGLVQIYNEKLRSDETKN